jgi:ribosomal protein L11 methyltransferase
MRYYEYDFTVAEPADRERLIALLSVEGFDGFEEDGDGLLAYISIDQAHDQLLDSIFPHFPDLNYVRSELDDVNWNQQWENGFEPVVVGDFAAVRANFHPAVPNVRFDLVITPKMSFGTGHHPTTHLMIQEMAHVDMRGKRVMDFGTGTGVLGILADNLGADFVLGIDNDEWSIRNTEENIDQNAAK